MNSEQRQKWYYRIFKWKPHVKVLVKQTVNQSQLDKRTIFVGQIRDKYGFMILIMLLNMKFEDTLEFPLIIFSNGGATFLICYFFLSFLIVIPIYLIEVGLGQFYSRTGVKIYNVIPIFKGLGWTGIVLNLFILVPNSNIVSWCNFFFVYSAYKKPPWTYCSQNYTNFQCVNTSSVFKDKKRNFLTSSEIFFDIQIQGIRNSKSGELYSLTDGIGSIRINHLLSIMFVWAVIFIIFLICSNLYIKCMFGLLMMIWIILLFLAVKVIFLKGSVRGLYEYLNPLIDKTMTFESLQNAISHCLFSTSLAIATLSSISSLNEFQYNFYKASLIIALENFIFCFVCGLIEFSILGFMSRGDTGSINSFPQKGAITLVTFTESTSRFQDGQYYSMLFMFMLFSIGVCRIGISVFIIVLAFVDTFPRIFNYSHFRKSVCGFLVCLILFGFASIFSCSRSGLLLIALSSEVGTITIPVIVLLEVFMINCLYGAKRFRLDIEMMLGFRFSYILVISSQIIIPSLLIFDLFYVQYVKIMEKRFSKNLILSVVVSSAVLLPFFVYGFIALFTITNHFRRFADITKAFKSQEMFGPYFKRNWLKDRRYQRKLVELRKEPKFLKTVCETENMKEILSELKQKPRLSKTETSLQLKFTSSNI